MGKTNLLDAIYYLSFCKSCFHTTDSQNISFDADFFMLQGVFQQEGIEDEVYCGVKRGQKKIFKRNKKEYEILAKHIGLFPLVMISPADTDLITGGSEPRRKFIDGIISQFDPLYLETLMQYTAVLQQRNALLKHFAHTRTFDSLALEVWDEQLILHGTYIHKTRVLFLNEFTPVFKTHYNYISENKEQVDLQYISTVEESYKESLQHALKKDCALEHTSVGVHRDDITFLLNENLVRKFASQGQQKTYLLALKLAQYEFIKNKTAKKPLLLLDDVYDKLDAQRLEKLITLVSSDSFGQVFITDTQAERLHSFFALTADKKIFVIDNASVTEVAASL